MSGVYVIYSTGTVFIYNDIILAGANSWLAVLAGPRAALAMGIVPFVIADMIKVAIGAALVPSAEKLIARL